MVLTLRFAVFSAAFLSAVACSSEGSGDADATVPPFQGPLAGPSGITTPGAAGSGDALGTGGPGGSGPAAQQPAAQQPAEAEQEPASTPPSGTDEAPADLPLQPGDTPPADNGGAEQPPAEQPPAEEPAAEQPPAEQPPVEQPPAEQPPVEQPPAEPPPVFTTDVSSLPLPPGNAGQPEPAGNPGNLRVLDWAGFRSAVSYTFDDTNQTQIDHFNELMALNVKFTFYLITGGASGMRMQNPVWAQALAAGHELANHTRSHLNAGSAGLAQDTDSGENDIEQRFGNTVFTMAAPFGAADYVNIASSRYLINRGTNGGQVAANGNTNPFSVPTFIPNQGAPASAFNALVDQGRNNGTWHTVLVHGFLPQINGEFQPVDIGQFTQAVNYSKSFGDVWIDTVVEVGAYWLGQRAFNATPPANAGAQTTWTWTLPNHFPPNKFLRVTVDGGTLTQNGEQLPWNDHGFYEVALDKRSLTLSP